MRVNMVYKKFEMTMIHSNNWSKSILKYDSNCKMLRREVSSSSKFIENFCCSGFES